MSTPSRFEVVKSRVETIRPFADLTLTCLSCVAILAGGWWTYDNFVVEDTHEVSPNVTVSAETQPYDEKRSLLVVHVKPRNQGKVPLVLNGGHQGDIGVTVKAVPDGLPNGQIDSSRLTAVATAKGIVKRFKGYIIEPGAEYDEVLTFVVPTGATYVGRRVASLAITHNFLVNLGRFC